MNPIPINLQVPGVRLTVYGSTGGIIEGISPQGKLMIDWHGQKVEFSPEDKAISLEPDFDWEAWFTRQSGEKRV